MAPVKYKKVSWDKNNGMMEYWNTDFKKMIFLYLIQQSGCFSYNALKIA